PRSVNRIPRGSIDPLSANLELYLLVIDVSPPPHTHTLIDFGFQSDPSLICPRGCVFGSTGDCRSDVQGLCEQSVRIRVR
ncbi:hypothetical protein COCCADRAFT_98422, partial [Bipolaris zeicola 26-R-13]